MFGNDFKELFGNKIHQLVSRVFMKLDSQDKIFLSDFEMLGRFSIPSLIHSVSLATLFPGGLNQSLS